MDGAVLRLRTEFKCFRSLVPYDKNCDATMYGTGFVYETKEGTRCVLTAHHVVQNAKRVTITNKGGGEVLRIVGVQPHLDVAMLLPFQNDKETEEMLKNLPHFKGGEEESSDLHPQDVVVVKGYANADNHMHTTSGTVSGRTNWPLNRIQTDAAINHGCSGGPVTNSKGSIIGIATSGMDEMQATNHFVPMSEVGIALRRMMQRREEDKTEVGRELGLFLNACLHPIGPSALSGEKMKGGALVAETVEGNGLKKGDVILGVDTGGKMEELDSSMRINVDKVWKHDKLDFRVVLDRIVGEEESSRFSRFQKIKLLVLREGEVEEVYATVGPNVSKTREFFPDCEPVSYFILFGLVVQLLNQRHLDHPSFNAWCKESITDPGDELHSFPVITYVQSSSPFKKLDNIVLEGKRIVSVRLTKDGMDGEETPIQNLHELDRKMASFRNGRNGVVVTFKDGSVVGTTQEDVFSYLASLTVTPQCEENLFLHKILIPQWRPVEYDVHPGEEKREERKFEEEEEVFPLRPPPPLPLLENVPTPKRDAHESTRYVSLFAIGALALLTLAKAR